MHGNSNIKKIFISLSYWGGVTLPLCGTVVANRPIVRSMNNWWINTEHCWDDNWHRNTKVLRKKPCPSVTLIDHKPSPITRWSIWRLHGPKPATKLPWYATASKQYYKVTERNTCMWGFLMTTYGGFPDDDIWSFINIYLFPCSWTVHVRLSCFTDIYMPLSGAWGGVVVKALRY